MKCMFKPSILSVALASVSIIAMPQIYAAQKIDLSKNVKSVTSNVNAFDWHELKRMVDKNITLHVRVEQRYQSYPVLGADAVIHVPHGKESATLNQLLKNAQLTMNGDYYAGITHELAGSPKQIFTPSQSQKALKQAISLYKQAKGSLPTLSNTKIERIVYIDADENAHYAYQVSFIAEPVHTGTLPEMPVYILDAVTLHLYKYWNAMHQSSSMADDLRTVQVGGYGGNEKMGRLEYDGADGHPLSFEVTRNIATKVCTYTNPSARLKRNRNNNPRNLLLTFNCLKPDSAHNNIYWNGEMIPANGGYSTANDVFAHEQTVRRFFARQYGIPVYTKNGAPAQISFIINYPMSAATYAGGVLSLGDGLNSQFYPYTTQDVIAHELAHAVIEQYSQLRNTGQSGAVGESFGDFTAKAIEYHSTGNQSWTFGANIVKAKGRALRYLDDPTKDCGNRDPGDFCSIDHVNQYKSSVLRHHAAGVFNKALYKLSTAPGWDVSKVYDLLMAANTYYWTSNVDFAHAACGVAGAASDFGYAIKDVQGAFIEVGIDISQC